MKIFFSKKEYRQLLDVMFLGDWVVSGYSEDDHSPFSELREKIYACAKDFGYGDLIEYDKGENKHYETALFEEQGVMDKIETYNKYVRQDDF